MGGRTRRGVLISGSAAGPALMAGCERAAPGGGQAAPAGARPGPGTTVAYLGNHNQAEAQVVEPQMKGFEQKFPGARVEVTNLTAGYDEKLQSMLAAGTPPDMFRTGGTGW